jgi:hypothetical protein
MGRRISTSVSDGMNTIFGNSENKISSGSYFFILMLMIAAGVFSCYSYNTKYNREGLVVKSHKTDWSLPSDIEPRVIKQLIRYWDHDNRLTRLDEERTAVAIATGLSKDGYVKWFFITDWFEIFVTKQNQDRLVSRKLDKNEKISEEFEINLIEYR